mmetsp:Transcript_20497/g.46328  ORF Transcript_20497/g.46328 Transcript_20497/m.46328 type:complete len:489 (-) Transcript_20497:40-1506(-)
MMFGRSFALLHLLVSPLSSLAVYWMDEASPIVLSAQEAINDEHVKKAMEYYDKAVELIPDVDKLEHPQEIKMATEIYHLAGLMYSYAREMGTVDKVGKESNLWQSVIYFEMATKVDPKYWPSYANMAAVLADVEESGNHLGKYEESLEAYGKAIELLESGEATDPPELGSASGMRHTLGELHYRMGLNFVPGMFEQDSVGEVDYEIKLCTSRLGSNKPCQMLASNSFHTALQHYPGHRDAMTALAIVTADATFGLTDPTHVRSLFDSYAVEFEDSLVGELDYNAFSRLRQSFDHAMANEGRSGYVLKTTVDCGCGTGLAGDVFRNVSETLVGIDLSPKMIEIAREKKVYDSLETGDIVERLMEHKPGEVSLIIAADAFNYFTELDELFAAMYRALAYGGYAIFSLENVPAAMESRLDEHAKDWRWQFQPSGRIAHRRSYIEKTLKSHEFDVALYGDLDGFRTEKGADVRGHMFLLKKNPPANMKLDEL